MEKFLFDVSRETFFMMCLTSFPNTKQHGIFVFKMWSIILLSQFSSSSPHLSSLHRSSYNGHSSKT